MAVRSLAIDIATRADTTALETANTQTDEFKQNTMSATDEVENLGDETTRFGDTSGRVGRYVVDNAAMIGAAFAGAGAGLEGLIRSQQELQEETRNVAIAMNETDDAVRDMVSGMTDFTFSTEDALAGTQRLIQSNVDNKKEIEELLPVFDKFSDATGLDMVDGIDAFYAAFSALDIPLSEAEEHLDTMTWLQNETRVEMSNLENVTRRFAPELKDMSVEVDELAVMLAAMEEAGMGGPKMMTHLRQAFNEGHESIEGVYDSVGLTNEVLENQAGRLVDAEGATEEYAAAHAESYTTLQKLHSGLMETNYAYGGFIENLDVLSPALMTVGTLLGTVAAASYLGAGAIATLGITIAGVTAPLWLVVGGVAAIAGGIYLLATRVDVVKDFFISLWDTLTDIGSYLVGGMAEAWREQEGLIGGIGLWVEWLGSWFTNLGSEVTSVVSFITDAWKEGEGFLGTTVRNITNTFGLAFDLVTGVVATAATLIWGIFTGDFAPLAGVFGDLVDNIQERFATMTDNVVGFFKNMNLGDIGINIIQSLAEGITSKISAVSDTASDVVSTITETFENFSLLELGSNIISSLAEGITGAVSIVTDAVTGVGESIRDGITGFFGISSPAQLTMEYGHNIVEGIASGITDGVSAAKEAVTGIGESIRDGITDFFGISSPSKLMMDYGGNITGGLGEGMKSKITSVTDTVSDIADGIRDSVTDFFGISSPSTLMMEYGGNIITGLRDGMISEVDDVKETITNIGNSIREGITDFFGISSPSTLMMEYGDNIGEGLSDGLTKGISDRISSIRKSATNIASSVGDSITDFFGINSPAQLTMEYGHNIAEGMGQGMEQGTDEIDRGTQRMYEPAAEAPTPRPTRTAGAGATQNNYIEINIEQRDGESITETTRRGIRDTVEDEISNRFKKLRYKIQAGEL